MCVPHFSVCTFTLRPDVESVGDASMSTAAAGMASPDDDVNTAASAAGVSAFETPALDNDTMVFEGNPLRTYPQPKLADLQVPEDWIEMKQRVVDMMNTYRVSQNPGLMSVVVGRVVD